MLPHDPASFKRFLRDTCVCVPPSSAGLPFPPPAPAARPQHEVVLAAVESQLPVAKSLSDRGCSATLMTSPVWSVKRESASLRSTSQSMIVESPDVVRMRASSTKR